MQIYDISMSIDENIAVYGNQQDKKPVLTVSKDYTSGNYYETRIDMDMHTGTHIDAPLHMLQGGHTMEGYDIARFVTECIVLDLTKAVGKITAADLRGKEIKPGAFILLKTKNSAGPGYDPEFVYLEASGARYLKELGISGVGIDSLGIERAQPGHETHKTLLGSGIVILEGLRLSGIEEGAYQLIALPLKICGTEAAPARAILMR
jgi:arylformamidase